MLKTLAVALVASAALFAAPAQARLSDAAHESLLRALDDEWRAEAFYAAIIERFGPARPFSNIIEAERRHSGSLIALLDEHGHETPENPHLGSEAIDALVPESLAAACAMGVEAEIENARLYDEELLPTVADYPEVAEIFVALRDASAERHLPAFERCGGARGAGFGRNSGGGRGPWWAR